LSRFPERAAASRRVDPLRLVFVWLTLLLLAPLPCRADPAEPRNLPVLSYSAPQDPHYVRLLLEQLAILGAGLGQYSYNSGANSRDWEFDYDWRSFRARLDGEAYSLDNNRFDTNFLLHPLAGSLYYLGARSNQLGPFAALAVTFGSSALWEYFGEFRERVSINDLLVTPLAGMAWGETSTQLGAYFLRACPSLANETLGSTFAPLIAIHDAVDGAERLHTDCNTEARAAHRFRLSLNGGEAWSEGLNAYPQLRANVQTEVMHLPGFGQAGQGWSVFSDGNVSRFGLSVSFADWQPIEAMDVTLLTQTVITGVHYRNSAFHGGQLRRREAVFGLLVGAEYSRHRYDGWTAPDHIFLLDLPAVTTRYYGRGPNLAWELTLDAGGIFGGASAFALSRASRSGAPLDLTSVASVEGYDHVFGVALSPRARLELGSVELGVDVRSDRMFALRALDVSGRVPQTPVTELRRRSSLWVALGAPGLERFLLSANWLQRVGTMGDVRVSRNELSLNLGFELAP